MKDIDLIQALKRIKVQTGSLMCVGCGHEHNCGVHGCAVIREAAQRLEEYHQGEEHIDRKAWEKPCKVGDKVFQQNGVDIFESQVTKIIYDCGHFAFDEEAIGERVFLTRESAEAALKGEQA